MSDTNNSTADILAAAILSRPKPKKRVLIACSAKGGVPHWWFDSYAAVFRLGQAEYDFTFAVESGNSAINISRNIAVQHAIDENFWKLVQIDKDQFWKPEHLLQLIKHDVPIVAGPYCKKKSGPIKWLIVRKPEAKLRPDGLLECDYMGTGMFSTEVAALRKMCEFFPERSFQYEDEDGSEKTMTELFPIGLVGPNTPEGRISRIREVMAGDPDPASAFQIIKNIIDKRSTEPARMLGEDYFFCHLARKAGIPLYCDTQMVVGHVGDAVYPITSEMCSVPAEIPTHGLKLDRY